MGKIEFADCQDVRGQIQIVELDCPKCHEPGGIEVFMKDGLTVEDSACVACGYVIPGGSNIHDIGEE